MQKSSRRAADALQLTGTVSLSAAIVKCLSPPGLTCLLRHRLHQSIPSSGLLVDLLNHAEQARSLSDGWTETFSNRLITKAQSRPPIPGLSFLGAAVPPPERRPSLGPQWRPRTSALSSQTLPLHDWIATFLRRLLRICKQISRLDPDRDLLLFRPLCTTTASATATAPVHHPTPA